MAKSKTKTKTPWDPYPHKVMDIHHRRSTIQIGRSNLLKSRPSRLQHQREKKQPCRKREQELDYEINLPAALAPPPPNPVLVFPVANIQLVIGRLSRRERWLLVPMATCP